jgi:recombination protein RecA
MEAIKQGSEVIGNRVRVRVKKNKVAPPFKVAEFDIMFDRGISKEGSLLDVGVDIGVIEKRGSFYSYGETRLGQGRENVKQFLVENEEIASQIETDVREQIGLGKKVASASDSDDDTETDSDSDSD